MVESIITVSIASVAGVWALTKNLYDRLDRLDRRLDRQELKVAEEYVTRAEMREICQTIEDHCTRIEVKLDKLILKDRR